MTEVVIIRNPVQTVNVTFQAPQRVNVVAPTTVATTSTSQEIVNLQEILGIVGPQGIPGEGGGSLDTAMPKPTAPTLFTRGILNGIAWDGLDVNGNPMPVGFQHVSVQHQVNSYAPYAPVADFDASGVTSLIDPYLPTGWVNANGSTMRAVANTDLPPGVYASATDSIAFGPFGTSFSQMVVQSGSIHQRLTVTVPPPGGSISSNAYLLFGLDALSTPTPNGMLVAMSWGADGLTSATAVYKLNSDGTFVAGSLAGGFVIPSNHTFVVTYEDGVLSFTDLDGTVLMTGTVIPVEGMYAGLFSAGTAQAILAMTVSSAVGTPGPWVEVATLAGTGTAVIPTDGLTRLVAVNQAGNAGAASDVATIAYPVFAPTLAADADVHLTSVQDGQALVFDVTSGKWINATVAGTPGSPGPPGADSTVPGPPGTPGNPGPTGAGLPVGGTVGQVPKKNSGTNYDLGWMTPPSFRGVWDGANSYVLNDLVTYAGHSYVCTTAHAPTGAGASYVGSTNVSSLSAATTNISLPAGSAAGDVAMLVIAGEASSQTQTGFGFIGEVASGLYTDVFTRTLNADDISAGLITISSTQPWASALLYVMRSVIEPTAGSGFTVSNTSGNVLPSYTAASSGLAVAVFQGLGNPTSMAVSGGYGNIAYSHGSANNDVGIIASQACTSGATVPTGTATSTPPLTPVAALQSCGGLVFTSVITVSPDPTNFALLGADGATGPIGPVGPTGAAVEEYSLVAVSSWTQTHGFTHKPAVMVLDNGTTSVNMQVEYPTSSSVHLQFPIPFTGQVVLQ